MVCCTIHAPFCAEPREALTVGKQQLQHVSGTVGCAGGAAAGFRGQGNGARERQLPPQALRRCQYRAGRGGCCQWILFRQPLSSNCDARTTQMVRSFFLCPTTQFSSVKAKATGHSDGKTGGCSKEMYCQLLTAVIARETSIVSLKGPSPLRHGQ